MGQYAHIIADSPDGARGIVGESERLAADPNNLMLTCLDCHNRIDRNGQSNPYTAEQLTAMKRDHEARINLVYSATGAKDSLPILMAFPVGSHVPVIDLGQVHEAMLKNSNYSRFPVSKHIHIDRGDFDVQDDSPDFWPLAEGVVTRMYERQILPEITSRGGTAHLTIAAFAPIPMLMKLGALLGDKTEAMVLDLPGDKWIWDVNSTAAAPEFTFDVPATLPSTVSALVSLSNRVVSPTGAATVEFRATSPGRGIIRQDAHLQIFRREFNSFLMALARAGVRNVHIHPATPLCASVEIGRLLLPKLFEEVHVWEWRAPDWKQALRLK